MQYNLHTNNTTYNKIKTINVEGGEENPEANIIFFS